MKRENEGVGGEGMGNNRMGDERIQKMRPYIVVAWKPHYLIASTAHYGQGTSQLFHLTAVGALCAHIVTLPYQRCGTVNSLLSQLLSFLSTNYSLHNIEWSVGSDSLPCDMRRFVVDKET